MELSPWTQRFLCLPHAPEGVLPISDWLQQQVPEIRQYQYGIANVFWLHTSASLAITAQGAAIPDAGATSITVPIHNGRLVLGQYQHIYFKETRSNAGLREIAITIQGCPSAPVPRTAHRPEKPTAMQLDHSQIIQRRLLGSGTTADVFRCKLDGKSVAVKYFKPGNQDNFDPEVTVMGKLGHANIIRLLGTARQPDAIVLEYMPNGTLFDVLDCNPSALDSAKRLNIARDIARGMHHMHSCVPPIAHRGLKSENILLDSDWNAKITDFGCTHLDHFEWFGSPEWQAPEVLTKQPFDHRSDVFSFGVILWELATGQVPWDGWSKDNIVTRVGTRNLLDTPEQGMVFELIRQCWKDVGERITFIQVLDKLYAPGMAIPGPET